MDKALKQRLVGAIVLIALAVIVLPMIFGGRSSTNNSEASRIELPAAPPDLDFETRRFPVGDNQSQTPTPQTESDDEETADQTVPDLPVPQPSTQKPAAIVEAGDQPPESIATEPEASTDETQEAGTQEVDDRVAAEEFDPTPAPTEAGAPLRYVVQVASFGSTENAARLAAQLEEAGYAVLIDHVSSETAQLNRVRVGPYAAEAEAQRVARQLRDRFSGINPRIVDLRPDETAPVIASDDPLMRWVVQVGSFGSQENASNLVSRLQASGLSAYEETVQTDTSTIYRVRVGPYLDRDEALQAEQRIGRDFGIDGVVMSSD